MTFSPLIKIAWEGSSLGPVIAQLWVPHQMCSTRLERPLVEWPSNPVRMCPVIPYSIPATRVPRGRSSQDSPYWQGSLLGKTQWQAMSASLKVLKRAQDNSALAWQHSNSPSLSSNY